MNSIVAFDVGGTNTKFGLFDSNLQIKSSGYFDTPKNDPYAEILIKKIEEYLNEFSSISDFSGIGISVPGLLDETEGVIKWAGNLGWRELALKRKLAEKFQLPIAFGHDVKSAGIAELKIRSQKNYDSALYISIGTGIAAALFLAEKNSAWHSQVSEIGHIKVSDKYICVCGQTGCLESVASTLAIQKNYSVLSRNSQLNSEEIVILANQGDKEANAIWQEALLAICNTCEILITIFSPKIIIFGGGLSNMGEELLAPINNFLKSSLSFQKLPKLEIASYGPLSGLYGSAQLALDYLKEIS